MPFIDRDNFRGKYEVVIKDSTGKWKVLDDHSIYSRNINNTFTNAFVQQNKESSKMCFDIEKLLKDAIKK